MKKHDYINLKMGDSIDQYCMVVPKKDLAYWRNLGWLTFIEVGLPKGDEKASMLYGDIRKNETLIFNRPTLLKDINLNKIIGLQVVGFSAHLGTYGMGGAGFFGLLLNNSEYLTYAVWSAGDYVIINDRVVECNPGLYYKTKPWCSEDMNEKWNDLTNYISESSIINISLGHDTCTLMLEKNNEPIEVIFVKNDPRLPRKKGRKRNAYRKGNISDYILFQHVDSALIV